MVNNDRDAFEERRSVTLDDSQNLTCTSPHGRWCLVPKRGNMLCIPYLLLERLVYVCMYCIQLRNFGSVVKSRVTYEGLNVRLRCGFEEMS